MTQQYPKEATRSCGVATPIGNGSLYISRREVDPAERKGERNPTHERFEEKHRTSRQQQQQPAAAAAAAAASASPHKIRLSADVSLPRSETLARGLLNGRSRIPETAFAGPLDGPAGSALDDPAGGAPAETGLLDALRYTASSSTAGLSFLGVLAGALFPQRAACTTGSGPQTDASRPPKGN